MRAMSIAAVNENNSSQSLMGSFRQNYRLYLAEALGLAIFMISACFFGALLESKAFIFHSAIPDAFTRRLLMGFLMGVTALFIFYSPFTAPSGAHINPAVTISFCRLGKITKSNAFFFIVFQFIGGTAAVYLMQALMGSALTNAPVNSVVTVPGKTGELPAAAMEFVTAFLMMAMVLLTSGSGLLKKYTRFIAACMVCIYVVVAGQVSGFGMNPARSFASAFPSGIYTSFWIYMLMPFAGMLAAAECSLRFGAATKKSRLKMVYKRSMLAE